MKIKLLIALVIFLNGCGYDYSSDLKGTEQTEQTEQTEESQSVKKADSETKKVEKKKTSLPLFVYYEIISPMYEAEDNAPAGYHLPSRLELLNMKAKGLLTGIKSVVWTSETSLDRDDYVYVVRLRDETVMSYWRECLFGAVYVRD